MKNQFGIIIVEILFFIVAIIAGYIFISMAYNNVNNIVGAVTVRSNVISSRMLTDLQIISCSYNNTTSTLSIYVGNYGNQFLNQSQTILFINGQLANSRVSLIYTTQNTGYWGPNDIIQINTTLINEGLFYIRVVASNGAYAESRIYVNATLSQCNLL